MASTSAALIKTSYSLPLGIIKNGTKQPSNENHLILGGVLGVQVVPVVAPGTGRSSKSTRRNRVVAAAAAGGGDKGTQKKKREGPAVDTRIHWDDPEEGWVGSKDDDDDNNNSTKRKDRFERFSELLNDMSDSHYQFLGVPAEADVEEIKAAYRRLSKEYHPDTTSLPLKTASEKFMRLREIYDVLSDQEKRRFYDWTLAQEAASRQAEKMMLKFEDPYEQDVRTYVPKLDVMDTLDGRNLELSDQAMSALTFDVVVILFGICCLVYVVYFKEPY